MTYICMDIHTSAKLLAQGSLNVYLLGGKLTPYGTSSGAFGKEFLNSIATVDILIMSADGVDMSSGLCNDNESICNLKHKCLRKARKTIALLDHTKFTKRGFFKTCDFTDIDVLITDSKTPDSIIRKLRGFGITVDVVDFFAEDEDSVPSPFFRGI